tara:strand:- start:19 stop:708 length:690 start_codon:yes stop_codon:yes gene_type:complete
MLPKIDTPIFSFTQPSTGKDIRFRPFVVKEEKILMLANDGGEIGDMVSAAQQVVQNCIVDDIDVNDFTIFDLQWLFLKIKSKSTGEIQPFQLGCGACQAKVAYDLNLDEIEVQGLDQDHKDLIQVNENVAIKLKWPTAEVYAVNEQVDDEGIVAMCIDHVIDGEEIINIREEPIEEVIAFIESLPLNVYGEVKDFFLNMPKVEHIIEFTCPKCDKENYIGISGYEHFFG